MKPWMPVALLVAMSPVALAKPTPIEQPAAIVKAGTVNRGSVASVQENTGSIGAMREREYFEAKQPPINAFHAGSNQSCSVRSGWHNRAG